MDAVLTIESDEAVRLAARLAELTGKPVPAAVVQALTHEVADAQRRHDADALAAELVEIGRECAALLQPPFHSADHADLYDNDGLPT